MVVVVTKDPRPRDLYARFSDGRGRELYLGLMKTAREALEDTTPLRRWDAWTQGHPRTTRAHVRTLLSVHRAEDLVAFDLPWWTYRAVDRVDGILQAHGGRAQVFEFGAGASTVWLARRAESVVSVEHHPVWADRVRSLIDAAGLDNVEVVVPEVPAREPAEVPSFAPSGRGLDFRSYVDTLADRPGPYDLVAVDGRARLACLRAAVNHVSDNGVLLLDDAQRLRYQPGLSEASDAGWVVHRNQGASPCEPLRRETAVLSRMRSC